MASSLASSLFSSSSIRRGKMEVLTAVAAWALSSLCQNMPAGDADANHWLRAVCEAGTSCEQNTTELATRLSSGAEIIFPQDDQFANATNRWSSLDAPDVMFVVVVATEKDVSETVKYANQRKTPYLAINGGHGAIITQGRMKNGIEIRLEKLSTVKIAKNGKTATIGGGTLSKAVTDTLWAAGKQTVTGGCECTSILGPGLGGGHGFLQGRHGLIADQFLSMNIVHHDGTMETIDHTSELWWAMQGAGHNFAIVTSVTSKIYDVKHEDWAYQSFIFTGDKVEGLYEGINEYLLKNGTQPVDVINYSFFFNYPDIDPKNPVIMFYILQEGVKVVSPKYTKPFLALGAATTDSGAGSYTDLPTWTGNADTSAPCQKLGLTNIRFPIDLQTYNIKAQREVYDLFALGMQEVPALNNSLFLFEGYSLQGVKAVEPKSTAFPFRGDNLLVAPLLIYTPDGPELDKKAKDLGEGLRGLLRKGSGRCEMHSYVNYAFGDETTKNWYGYESWRQKKLKALKNKYDPNGRFSFYAPIV